MRVPQGVLDSVLEHCSEVAPDEACGLLVADRRDLAFVVNWIPMRNYADNSRGEYEMDDGELLEAWADSAGRYRRPVAIYHSHVCAPAVMSSRDVEWARDPQIAHLIVGLGVDGFEMRLWRVADGHPTEEAIRAIGPP